MFRLFSLVGDLVTRPQFMRDLEEEHQVARSVMGELEHLIIKALEY